MFGAAGVGEQGLGVGLAEQLALMVLEAFSSLPDSVTLDQRTQ